MHLDKQQTIAMLGALQDGDKPLSEGDSITTDDDVLTVSKVYGWKSVDTLVRKGEHYGFKPTRALQVSFRREGQKRAEKMWLHLPAKLEGA